MKRSTTMPRVLIVTLAVGLVCLLPACGVLGGNGGDEEKFPEPPDRPSNAHVVNLEAASQGAAPLWGSPAHRG